MNYALTSYTCRFRMLINEYREEIFTPPETAKFMLDKLGNLVGLRL